MGTKHEQKTRHQLMTEAIDLCRDRPDDPDSGYDIHFAVEQLEGELGMSATEWLAYYDDRYHQDGPVTPAPNPEIVLATFTPKPVLFNVYPSRAAADDDRAARNLDAYQPMTWAEYEGGHRAHYLSDPLREVTEDHWHEMLNILPPVAWQHRDGVERFIISEAESGNFHRQFAKRGDRHFSRLVDVRDPSTWITGGQCDALPKGFAAREAERRSTGETGQAGGRS